MRKMAGSPGHFPASDSLAQKPTVERSREGKRNGCVCPRAEDRFPDRQRQVMASPAMGSQAYRFTGLG